MVGILEAWTLRLGGFTWAPWRRLGGVLEAGLGVLEAGLSVLEAGLGGLERLLVTNARF